MLRPLALLALLALCEAFKTKFRPGNSTQFFPKRSQTFTVVPEALFFLGYADNSHLKGYQAKDVVQLGDYFTDLKFGAITDCNSPDFNGVDGIVGFGLPVAHPAPPPGMGGAGGGGAGAGMGGMMGGMGGGFKMPGVPTGSSAPALPPPILFSLTGTTRGKEQSVFASKTQKESLYIQRRAFSFMSTDTAAELQLGGYDPASIEGKMFVTPSISVSDYVAVGLSLKYGTTELLEFKTKNQREAYLPAIMDSGTSCLVIPDSNMGLLKDSPYQKWKGIVNDTAHPKVKESFFLNVAGAVFEIPYDDWFLAKSNQSCVQRAPKGFKGMLIGDVLFRRFVVLFDLTQFEKGTVLIGIAKQNKTYVPAKHPTKVNGLHKFPMHKKAPHKVSGPDAQNKKLGGGKAPPHLQPPMAMDRIPIYNKDDTQYFINVSIGTPRQQFTVIFDTGSAVFGVFSECSPSAPTFGTCMFGGAQGNTSNALMDGVIVVLSISLGAVLLGVGVNLYVRRVHANNEKEQLKQFRKTGGTSISQFGSERLLNYGAVGEGDEAALSLSNIP